MTTRVNDRLASAVVMLALTALVAACNGLNLPIQPKGSGTPAAGASANPSASPTPTATGLALVVATPTPSSQPSPSPLVSATPGPLAQLVGILPSSATLGMKPPQGATPFMAATIKLTAEVTLSDGSKTSDVEWESRDPGVATVAPDGTITAQSKPDAVTIVAWSRDHLASGSIIVSVVDLAGIGVIIQ